MLDLALSFHHLTPSSSSSSSSSSSAYFSLLSAPRYLGSLAKAAGGTRARGPTTTAAATREAPVRARASTEERKTKGKSRLSLSLSLSLSVALSPRSPAPLLCVDSRTDVNTDTLTRAPDLRSRHRNRRNSLAISFSFSHEATARRWVGEGLDFARGLLALTRKPVDRTRKAGPGGAFAGARRHVEAPDFAFAPPKVTTCIPRYGPSDMCATAFACAVPTYRSSLIASSRPPPPALRDSRTGGFFEKGSLGSDDPDNSWPSPHPGRFSRSLSWPRVTGQLIDMCRETFNTGRPFYIPEVCPRVPPTYVPQHTSPNIRPPTKSNLCTLYILL
jgi:hypothetical protein